MKSLLHSRTREWTVFRSAIRTSKTSECLPPTRCRMCCFAAAQRYSLRFIALVRRVPIRETMSCMPV